jgi:hypothetical protein
MSTKTRNVKRLAVEIDAGDFRKIETNARREHRSFSDEVRRIIKEAYTKASKPVAQTPGAT